MKKTIIIIAVLTGAAGLIIWGIFASRGSSPLPTIKSSLGEINETVLVTGTTKATQSVDLSFERTGKVSAVYVQIGDRVRAGQALVELEKSDVEAQLAQAQASLASQQAQLQALERGTRPEQIAVQEVTVANAQIADARSRKALLDSLNDAYAKADDAARGKTDENFTNPRNATPTLNFQAINTQYNIDLPNKKVAVENALVAWKPKLDAMTVNSDLLAASAEADAYLSVIQDFLDELVAAHNNIIPGSAASSATWKTDAAAARTELGTAISALSTAETALRSASATLILAQKNLTLLEAGSTPEQIAAQRAAVAQAQANVQSVQVSLSKTVLRSPIDGVVTVQGAKLGQIVTVTTASASNQSLISIISEKKLEVDAYVPEVDIAKIALGQPVEIAFDALSGEKFSGKVMEIDPAETVISGVVNYQIKVALETDDQRVKSGLTANSTIKTATKKDVVLLPQYAILQNDSGTFVRVPDGKTTKDVPIKLGIRGQDGFVEIISGIEAGVDVVNVGMKAK
jgi:HlyD family secretion protein